jgi:DNA/RNA-binding domain of Phe-tRNA-synthetase-like protein
VKVHCAQELFEKFPAASIHGVVVGQLDLVSEKTAQAWKVKAQQSVADSGIRAEQLVEVPEIREWRNAFQAFGLKPSKYRSSIEQLYRRALKGDIIETRLPLVNLYCYFSLIHRTPMGAYDLQKTSGNIAIRPALAGEEFQAIGEKQAIRSDGEVIVYADQNGIICWGWNHRDCARTCLSADTRRAIFFADSVTESTRAKAEEAIRVLSEVLSSSSCTKIDSFTLDKDNSEAWLSF